MTPWKKWRIESGIGFKEVAERCHTTGANVSLFERGIRMSPMMMYMYITELGYTPDLETIKGWLNNEYTET